MKRIVSGIIFALLLIGMLTLAFTIQPVKATGTIYIRADGSVDPPTARIQRDGDVYTFTDNIHDQIVVERSHIIVDGNRHTLQGYGQLCGFHLYSQDNVTIQNTRIEGFESGIWLAYSSNNSILGNNITANYWFGVILDYFSNSNSISGNNITNNSIGVGLYGHSDNNSISENNIANNDADGIALESSNNTVVRNNIAMTTTTGLGIGISLTTDSSNNHIYHNNFIETGVLTYTDAPENFWDNGYPSGGNYWTLYDGIDVKRDPGQDLPGSDGIGDTPRVINKNNKDRYPLMNPYGVARPSSPPVGGYSFQTEGYTATNPLTPYLALIAVLAIGFTAIRPKTTRKAK